MPSSTACKQPLSTISHIIFSSCMWLLSAQERLPEGGEDPVPPQRPQHYPPAGGVCEQRPPLHGHRVHGVRRPQPVSVSAGAPG